MSDSQAVSLEMSFDQFYHEFSSSLNQFVLSRIGYFRQHDAEDLQQTAWMQFNKHLLTGAKFVSLKHARNTLYLIAKRVMADAARSNKLTLVSVNSEADEAVMIEEIAFDESIGQEEIVIRKEEIEMIEAVLPSMDQELRIAISLYVFGMMPISRISVTIGVPDSSVRSRIKRGIVILREAMRERSSLPKSFLNPKPSRPARCHQVRYALLSRRSRWNVSNRRSVLSLKSASGLVKA